MNWKSSRKKPKSSALFIQPADWRRITGDKNPKVFSFKMGIEIQDFFINKQNDKSSSTWSRKFIFNIRQSMNSKESSKQLIFISRTFIQRRGLQKKDPLRF